ncbi:MAG: adenylate kinase [Candidatus Eremiobacteraeota bacterium]|nr:adenylate kinase [Candidatus Eremiobacteraeota bacterium]
MRLVMLGPPGAGKGTQARLLEEKYGARQISTGDILRKQRASRSPLGKEAEAYMDSGALVPDDLMVRMMEGELAGASSFVLDGFPRTVAQATALDDLLVRLGLPLTVVLLFECDRERLVARLSGRWSNPRNGRTYHLEFNPPKVAGIDDGDGGPLVQRPDDSPEVVENRLATYEAQTSPLIDYYSAAGLLARIDGLKDIDAVTQDVIAVLDARSKVAS